jgi:hypothetical protein
MHWQPELAALEGLLMAIAVLWTLRTFGFLMVEAKAFSSASPVT